MADEGTCGDTFHADELPVIEAGQQLESNVEGGRPALLVTARRAAGLGAEGWETLRRLERRNEEVSRELVLTQLELNITSGRLDDLEERHRTLERSVEMMQNNLMCNDRGVWLVCTHTTFATLERSCRH